jgi:DpnII restriction endonuclease
MIEDLVRGAGELQKFLARVEDLGREGFPYLDAALARTELQFRECIRRIFGEKSPEFQEHRQHRLLLGSPEETRKSITLIKSLIATLEQKRLDLQGGQPPQQILATPPASPVLKPPQMTLVPASVSTVQMSMTQSGPVIPPPVAMAVALTTNLDVAPPIIGPNPPQPSLPPSDSSREPEIPTPSAIPPQPSLVSPVQTTAPMLPAPEPMVQVHPEPQQQLSSQAAQQTAQTDVSHAARPPQQPRREPTPPLHPIPSAVPQLLMPEAVPVPPHVLPHPSVSIGPSTHQDSAPQSPQSGSDAVEIVRVLCSRFHPVARQLRLRGEYRATVSVDDELDVQDLLHALLRIQFDDIGTEEWTPSYAEGASRTTFLLNDNRLAVLAKKTRNGLTAKDLTEQLRIDTERYRTKSRCTSLLCFIYDPEGRIGNPRAFETSLTTVSDSLTIDVLVAPK